MDAHKSENKIRVLGRATSSNVQAVMWGAGELGLNIDRLDYGHIHGGTDSAAFLALNPNGLVPVVQDGDLTIFESCAILRYLAARYQTLDGFWPEDPRHRAPIDQWAEWGKTSFAREFTAPIFWVRVRTAAKDRNEQALARALAHFDGLIDLLEHQIGANKFVCGDDFTLADIVIGHVLYRYFDIDIARKDHPILAAYHARLKSRAAYQQHVMVSYAPLLVQGA